MKRDLGKLKSFSEIFEIRKNDVERLGFFDITPAVDSRLYIDPKLLTDNDAPFFIGAKSKLKSKFDVVISAISKAKELKQGDIYFDAAVNGLTFTEIHGTCLGYAESNIYGNSLGPKKVLNIISRIKQLTNEGFISSDLMELISIFTPGFGCDLTSDLITFVIRDVIFEYNESIIKELNLEQKEMVQYMGHKFLANPFKGNIPILLLPKCILSDLPICYSFEDISNASFINEETRKALQEYIDINKNVSKNDFFNLMSKNTEFTALILDMYQHCKGNKYDFEKDPLCLSKYKDFIRFYSEKEPDSFIVSEEIKQANTKDTANECLKIFKHLVEDCGGWKIVKNFNEKGIQFLFYALSYSICKFNQISIFPEVDFGVGPIDFLFDNAKERVSIEVKKSDNTSYLHGISKQLPDYMNSNESDYGIYVFVNLDEPSSKKIDKIYAELNNLDPKMREKISIVVIQANERPSASKL